MSRPFANDSVFRAIADPTRRRIIEHLRPGERCVSDLVQLTKKSMPTLSHHLSMLRLAGVIEQRRAHTSRYYRLNINQLKATTAWLRSVGA
jgi:DNA-binding transcriptional ArsR family regulator